MANELSNLRPSAGSTQQRTRVGRGEGAGKGKTAGRGTKGAKSRSGYKQKHGFEGGQMPIYRRLPKKGFYNIFQKRYTILNLERLEGLEAGTVVTAEFLKEHRLIRTIQRDGVKLLGQGEIGVALHVRVTKVSRTAAEKIVAAGGTVEGPLPSGD
jgi:large subunit ribosomal protein L15